MTDGPNRTDINSTGSAGINITGGVGEYEAAAIIVVFRRLLEEADAARAALPPRRRPPAWTQAYQDPHPDDPLTRLRPESRGRPSPR